MDNLKYNFSQFYKVGRYFIFCVFFWAVTAGVWYLDYKNIVEFMYTVFPAMDKDKARVVTISVIIAIDISPLVLSYFVMIKRKSIARMIIFSMTSTIILLGIQRYFSFDLVFNNDSTSDATILTRKFSVMLQVFLPISTSIFSFGASCLKENIKRDFKMDFYRDKANKDKTDLIYVQSILVSVDLIERIRTELESCIGIIISIANELKEKVRSAFVRYTGIKDADEFIKRDLERIKKESEKFMDTQINKIMDRFTDPVAPVSRPVPFSPVPNLGYDIPVETVSRAAVNADTEPHKNSEPKTADKPKTNTSRKDSSKKDEKKAFNTPFKFSNFEGKKRKPAPDSSAKPESKASVSSRAAEVAKMAESMASANKAEGNGGVNTKSSLKEAPKSDSIENFLTIADEPKRTADKPKENDGGNTENFLMEAPESDRTENFLMTADEPKRNDSSDADNFLMEAGTNENFLMSADDDAPKGGAASSLVEESQRFFRRSADSSSFQ